MSYAPREVQIELCADQPDYAIQSAVEPTVERVVCWSHFDAAHIGYWIEKLGGVMVYSIHPPVALA